MRIILGIALAAVVVVGCGDPTSSGSGVDVVASFYPLAEAAAVVGGPAVHVTNLTKPGVEPHDLEPTTRQVDALLDADLVIDMGRGFQPGVEDVTKHRDTGTTLTVLDAVTVHAGADPHVWLDPVTMRAIADAVHDALRRL